MAKRLAEGHSKLEVIRCLKRYIAREVFTLIGQRQKEINQARITARRTEGRPRQSILRDGLSCGAEETRPPDLDVGKRKLLRL